LIYIYIYIYIYTHIYICDISSLRVNGPSEPGRLRDVCVCQWVNVNFNILFKAVLLCISW